MAGIKCAVCRTTVGANYIQIIGTAYCTRCADAYQEVNGKYHQKAIRDLIETKQFDWTTFTETGKLSAKDLNAVQKAIDKYKVENLETVETEAPQKEPVEEESAPYQNIETYISRDDAKEKEAETKIETARPSKGGKK